MAVIESNPYGFHRKQVESEWTECETCEGRKIKSKDWRSHSSGKMHRQNQQKVENALKANGHLASESTQAAWAASDATSALTDVTNKPKSGNPNMVCHKCNEVGHMAKECFAGVECRKCKTMGHMAKDCPTATNTAFACHNCGNTDHKARDCPEPRVPTCHNCDQKGHISKECPEERIPKCKNCDEKGHFSRECPLPKDWSRVQCNNCQQMGHGAKRCPNETVEAAPVAGWEDSAGAFSSGGGGGATGGWDSGAATSGDGIGGATNDTSGDGAGWADATPATGNDGWATGGGDNAGW